MKKFLTNVFKKLNPDYISEQLLKSIIDDSATEIQTQKQNMLFAFINNISLEEYNLCKEYCEICQIDIKELMLSLGSYQKLLRLGIKTIDLSVFSSNTQKLASIQTIKEMIDKKV